MKKVEGKERNLISILPYTPPPQKKPLIKEGKRFQFFYFFSWPFKGEAFQREERLAQVSRKQKVKETEKAKCG